MDSNYLKLLNRYGLYNLSKNLIQPCIFNRLNYNMKNTYIEEMNCLLDEIIKDIGDNIKVTNTPYIIEAWDMK